jgi:hypothetical protein
MNLPSMSSTTHCEGAPRNGFERSVSNPVHGLPATELNTEVWRCALWPSEIKAGQDVAAGAARPDQRPVILHADPWRRAQPYFPLTIKVSESPTRAIAPICRLVAKHGVSLAGSLEGALRRWRISGFAAPERPWLDHAAAPSPRREE